MSESLNDALSGAAWSVSNLIYDLDDLLDDEGRPVAERRAKAAVRAGVEMDVRPCPYPGIRQGHFMNVSALAQISRYLDCVLDEIAAFRRQVGGRQADWSDILAAVMDQLARPVIHLLTHRDANGPVPAKAAVGHKLAAGFFGVMRNLHERLALGGNLAVTTDAFLDLVDETGALLGASEACAGPPKLIRKASRTLVEGAAADGVRLDGARIDIARCLALQVQLGIFWRLYDRAHLWVLTRSDFRAQLTPYNDYLRNKLDRAGNELKAAEPAKASGSRLPAGLDAGTRQTLSEAVDDTPDAPSLQEDRETAARLLDAGGSLIRYDGDHAALSVRVARYLHARRAFVDELTQRELQLRTSLGFPTDAPVRLGAIVFPSSQALPWYELILGCRIGESGRLTGGSAGLRAPVRVAHS